jgi:uncharacterized protein (TIGR02147 family)
METPRAKDYRELLKDELAARCQRNPRYSQRAFARDIEMPPHKLSEVLRGKQGLSRPTAERIGKNLGMNAEERRRFCDLVDQKHGRSLAKRQAAAARLARDAQAPKTLDLDRFHLISDWYHLAILELAKVAGFKGAPRWIAGCLGITEAEAKLALERLERLGMIRREGDAVEVREADNAVSTPVPSVAVKNFHRTLIERGLQALQTQALDAREFNSTMLAVPRAKVGLAQERIRSFWRDLAQELTEAGTPADDLYALTIQFFHLTDRRFLEKEP